MSCEEVLSVRNFSLTWKFNLGKISIMAPIIDNDTRNSSILLQSDPYISSWKRKQAAQQKGMTFFQKRKKI